MQAQDWKLQVPNEIRNSLPDYSGNEVMEIPLDIVIGYPLGSTAMSYYFTFNWGQYGSGSDRAFGSNNSTDKILYNIYDSSRSVVLGNSNVISGTFENVPDRSEYHTHNLLLIIPIQTDFPAEAQYMDSVRVEGYTGTPGGSSQRNWKDFSIATEIQVTQSSARVCEISIVDTGAPFDSASTSKSFDFGNITSGDSRSAEIVVSSTDPYDLSLRSGNNGAMMRTDAVDTVSKIPYHCFIDGVQVNLSSAFTQIASGTATSPEGDRYGIEIEIGDFWGINTGDYEDIIYMELSSH